MIATNVTYPSSKKLTTAFVNDYLPPITARLESYFRNHADAEELIGEAIAQAWAMFISACRRGREVTASTLAYYVSKAVLTGRKFTAASNLDALSTSSLARERIGVHVSLSELGEGPGFYQVFGDRRSQWSPADLVSVKVDFEDFVANHCDSRDRSIIIQRLTGVAKSDVANLLGISRAAVSQRLAAMRRRWMAMAAA